jgi:hypothetical protein
VLTKGRPGYGKCLAVARHACGDTTRRTSRAIDQLTRRTGDKLARYGKRWGFRDGGR